MSVLPKFLQPKGRRGIKPNFVLVPSKLPPAYERIRKSIEANLEELKELGKREKLSEQEHDRIARLLNRIGRTSFYELGREVTNHGTGENKLASFEREFGHPAPLLTDLSEDGKIRVSCAANAILQNVLLSHEGFGTGVFTMKDHVVAAVKLGGKTYVLDPNTYWFDSAPTVSQYAKTLLDAHSKHDNPFHELARTIVTTRTPEIRDFTSAMKYFGGVKASVSTAYFNAGTQLCNTRRDAKTFDRAARLFSEAVRLNPNYAQANLYLGRTLYSLGQKNMAAPFFDKALKLDRGSPELYEILAKLYSDGGEYAKAKTCYENAARLDDERAAELLSNAQRLATLATRPAARTQPYSKN